MINIPEHLQPDVIMYAFRYTLGRRTYAVGTMVEVLASVWYEMPSPLRHMIADEIRQAIDQNCAGMDMDVAEWMKILELHDNGIYVGGQEKVDQ